jgi:DNA-binding NarL/FixJ family response regulator
MNTSAPTLSRPDGAARPRAALRLRDPQRADALGRRLAVASEAEAEVLVLELRPGERVPEDAAAFDGALLVLSDDPAHAADMALAGVLPHGAADAQIVAAVAALAAGLSVRLPGRHDPPGFAAREATPRPALTPREVEILALVGEGLSNKAIARRLSISAHTVKYHLEAVFAKLGVRSRAEAVTRGLRLGVHML